MLGAAGAAAMLYAAASLVELPGERLTPAGVRRNQSTYVRMRDGTLIAVDLWLPADYRGGRIPAVLRATRYGRAREVGPAGRLLWKLGLADRALEANAAPAPAIEHFNGRGYAMVIADGRGSGASFGSRRAECAPEEIADYAQILDWISGQAWSNHRIGAWGISQDGVNIELLAAQGRTQLKAIAPLYTTMDSQFTTTGIGGVYNRENVATWASFNRIADHNLSGCKPRDLLCKLRFALVLRGAKPVDGADGSSRLKEAVAQRHNYDVVEGWGTLLYREDPLGRSRLSMRDIMPYGVRHRIEASGVPIFSYYGWQDAGLAYSGLAHFINFSNPQFITVGPFSHGGGHDADPYRRDDPPPRPGSDAQLDQVADFFDRFVKEARAPPRSRINYYILGSGQWRTTSAWPPAGLAPRLFQFGANGNADSGASVNGSDSMKVDFTASSGSLNRYRSIVDASDIDYPDRAKRTSLLLHYDTPPLSIDSEITGSAIASLYLSSTRSDGAAFVYVDDVAPDGHLAYLTEGVLRLLFNKPPRRPPPYASLAVNRGYWRDEASLLEPGRVYHYEIELLPVSALIRSGHRLRFSVAGADALAMSRVPATGPAPVLTVYRGKFYPSGVSLPMRDWTSTSPRPRS